MCGSAFNRSAFIEPMCFSPEADLVGGIVIGAVGVDTLRHCRSRREVPIASLPVLLAGHQLVETFVWWSAMGKTPPDVGRIAMWLYLLFAFCVLPLFVPLSMRAVEPRDRRRRLMAPFALVGGVVAGVLFLALLLSPPSASIGTAHIAYKVAVPAGGYIVVPYIVATCGPFFLSSYRHAVAFGVVNLAAALVLAWALPSGFASLWCGWAALTSGAIALHLRFAETHRGGEQRVGVEPRARWQEPS